MAEMWSDTWDGSGSGDLVRTVRPRAARNGQGRQVIVMGGMYSQAVDWADSEATSTYKPSELVSYGRGLTVGAASVDETWGNAEMRARIDTCIAANRAKGYFTTDRVSLLGGSMGGLCALTYALANPTKVRRIVVAITPFDLQRVYDDDWGGVLRASMVAALGGPPTDADNPIARMDELAHIPMLVYASTDDPISSYEAAVEFANGTGATLETMGAIGHQFGPPYSVEAVASFLQGA